MAWPASSWRKYSSPMVRAGTKPSAPVSLQFHEQAGAVHAGDAAVEGRADAVGEEMRDQPVVGLAFGQHGAPLGR